VLATVNSVLSYKNKKKFLNIQRKENFENLILTNDHLSNFQHMLTLAKFSSSLFFENSKNQFTNNLTFF
jgi:hypothetical protein